MRPTLLAGLLCGGIYLGFTSATPAANDWLDSVDEALTFSAFEHNFRGRLSGLADLEGYAFDRPAPGLIDTRRSALFNPGLTLYVDLQAGSWLYGFVQARVDRGFDPSGSDARMRADEYAIRVTPWQDRRFSLQAGKFATIVGSWVNRHDSWESPFITAPLPYENPTPFWDSVGADSPQTLRAWGHVTADGGFSSADVYSDKYLRNPVIWGPSYTTGIAITGHLGAFEYGAEMKNSSLSSRPDSWDLQADGFEHPTFSARFGLRPNAMWNFGFSGSGGSYLLPEAEVTLPPGKSIKDYREFLLGQDISFAWHHWQVWAEFYEVRFEVPTVGHADTFAYYLEARYQITPQLFGALRWNQQLYGDIPDGTGGFARWGRDIWRVDISLGYRFTPRIQVKIQYSFQQEDFSELDLAYTLAAQFTMRF